MLDNFAYRKNLWLFEVTWAIMLFENHNAHEQGHLVVPA